MRNPPLRMQHGTMLGMHEPGGVVGVRRGLKRTTVGVLTLVCLECLWVEKLSLKYPLNGFLVFVFASSFLSCTYRLEFVMECSLVSLVACWFGFTSLSKKYVAYMLLTMKP